MTTTFIPCLHLGPFLRRDKADDGRSATVRACTKHGEASLDRACGKVMVCDRCPDYAPNRELLIAPLNGPLENRSAGRIAKKSLRYRTTLILPHLETPELLRLSVALWRLQWGDSLYIIVIDTGSSPGVRDQLEAMRSEDLEIHYLRRHFWHNSSAPVAAALDLGHALADTEYVLHSHVDLFPRRRDLLDMLFQQVRQIGIVGWEMSSRDHVPGAESWRGMVSHTCTLLHRRTIAASGARWSMVNAYDELGWWTKSANGWPDTESGFNVGLRKAGVVPKLLGSETNAARQITEWWDHARAYTAKKLAGRAEESVECAEAIRKAAERVKLWSEADARSAESAAETAAADVPRGESHLGRQDVGY